MEVVSTNCVHLDDANICDGEQYVYRGKVYSVAGTFRDTVRHVNNCDSIYVLHLSVYPKYVQTLESTIASGESYSLNGKVFNTTGTYRDTLKTMNGCDSIFVLNLEVTPTISIQRAYFGLNIYPNPSTDQVIIETRAVPQSFTVELFDVNAQLIRKEEWSGMVPQRKSWDLQKFPAGVYFIRFTAGKQVYVERLVKN
jgi:hypothetical protein